MVGRILRWPWIFPPQSAEFSPAECEYNGMSLCDEIMVYGKGEGVAADVTLFPNGDIYLCSVSSSYCLK